MANLITAAAVIHNSSATDATSYATASVTPVAGKIYYFTVNLERGGAVNPVTPTVTGGGVTWVQAADNLYAAVGATRARETLFRALGPGSAGALTIDCASTTHIGCSWVLDEISGADTSGTNGSGSVVQSAVGAGTSTTALATLAAFSSANNATYGVTAHASSANAITQGSGFTELQEEAGAGSGGGAMESEFQSGNDTTVDSTIATSVAWGMIALEIKQAGGSLIVPRRSSTLIRT